MFERFTYLARQSLFCALYRAEERNGDAISTEDLLGGLMMAAPNLLRLGSQDAELLRPAVTRDQLLARMRDELVAGGNTLRMREIPFSSSLKLTFERSVQEADDLRHATANAIKAPAPLSLLSRKNFGLTLVSQAD